jgi:ABC-type nitrate/sulfonate/bicarbonate transport system substrate-binding protein
MPLSPTRRGLLLGAGALPLLACPAIAQSLLRLRMVLNWRYQGPQGWFFLADDRGYFREAGLAVTMDQGNGSGAAVGAVASGSYDLGFGDINALIQLVARGPAGGGDANGHFIHLQPPPLHHRGEGRWPHSHAQGSGRPHPGWPGQ